jgi:tetratricopeptide (TPR) repeat protein
VGRVVFLVLAGSLAGLMLLAGRGRASLYTDDPRFIVPVGSDGQARPIEFYEFKRRLSIALNAADDRVKADGKPNSDRIAFVERITAAGGKKLSTIEAVALAGDLLRVGRLDEALNRVQPLVRDRNPNYFAFTALAHVYAARGDWREAVDYQRAAMLDAEMPAEVKGLSNPQRDWFARLDRDFVLPYYELRLKEAAALPRPNPVDEDVYPLFPVPERGKAHHPIRFVNEAGVYQPGVLAAVERGKLPPDAIAIVQQLMLWYPSDTRLFWLLAELYAAEGQFAAARDIMDVSVSEARQYGNRRILAEHRALVRAAHDAQPRKPSADEPLLAQTAPGPAAPESGEKAPISMKTIWIYFGVVAVIGLFAFIRMMSRRVRGTCGPVG